jgi:glycosyltransferase involved in cell wall biosynthesis
MKLVFAHDHIFVTWSGAVYSPGRLPYAAWQRYLEHFTSVVVVARGHAAKSAGEVEGLSRSDGPGVQFSLQTGRRGVARLFPTPRAVTRNLVEIVESADAVVARVPSRLGLRVANLATSAKRPVALEVVGSALHSLWHHGSLAAKLYAPILDVQTKLAARNASAALYVTREYLQKRYPCPGLVASASNVVIPKPDPKVLEERRTRLLRGRGELTLCFVGTLADRHKGLDTLLEALVILKACGKQCRLEVVGEGSPEPWIALAESLGVADRVHFKGTLPGSDAVREWMAHKDVFVLPSKGGEGLPRALIEAMSCGCHAIATNVGGVSELLPPSSMIRPGETRRLASLLMEVAADQQLLLDAISRNSTVAAAYASDVLEGIRRRFFGALAARARNKTGGPHLLERGPPIETGVSE